jgi:hypothetical protein
MVDNSMNSEIFNDERRYNQDGGKKHKTRKTVRGPDGKMYYGIVAPQYITKNGMKTKNKQARAAVWRRDYYRTKSGLTYEDLSKDDRGKIVSKKKQDMMKKGDAWKKYFGKKRAKSFESKKDKTKRKRKNKRKNKTNRKRKSKMQTKS